MITFYVYTQDEVLTIYKAYDIGHLLEIIKHQAAKKAIDEILKIEIKAESL